jgi:hypothetical protein
MPNLLGCKSNHHPRRRAGMAVQSAADGMQNSLSAGQILFMLRQNEQAAVD